MASAYPTAQLGMSRGVNGKVIVVTGASAGVGRATVRALAREGASLGLIARNEARPRAPGGGSLGLGARSEARLRAAAPELHVPVCGPPADVSSASALEGAAAKI